MPSPTPTQPLFVPDAPEIPADSLLFEPKTSQLDTVLQSPPLQSTVLTETLSTSSSEIVSQVVKEVSAEDVGLAERLEAARIKAQAKFPQIAQDISHTMPGNVFSIGSIGSENGTNLSSENSENSVINNNDVIDKETNELVTEPVLIEHAWTVVSTPVANPTSEGKKVSIEKTIDSELENVD
jgi:hypothetical protein